MPWELTRNRAFEFFASEWLWSLNHEYTYFSLSHFSFQIVRSSLNETDGSGCHWDVGLKSNVQHVFCLNQAGTHLLLISNESKAGTIYKVSLNTYVQTMGKKPLFWN
jgi:hypothetical protein